MSINSGTSDYHGVWWLPDSPDHQVPGVFHADPEGQLSLAVSGSLGAMKHPGFDLPEGEHRIVGKLDDGRGISLNRCLARSARGLLSVPRQEWLVHEAVFGALFDAAEPWVFYGASFSIPGLTRWVQWKGTQDTLEWDGEDRVRRIGVTVTIESWPLWETAGVRVELVRCASTRSISETTTEVESRTEVRVYGPVPMDREAFHRLAIRPLQVLLALSMGKFTAATGGRASIAPHDRGGRNHYLPWKWQSHDVSYDDQRARYGFSYVDWYGAGSARIDTWFSRLSTIEPVLDLYLASLRDIGLVELSFLIVVQALETFHRRTSDESVLDEGTWTTLREALTAEIIRVVINDNSGASKRDALLRKLDHFNEAGLRRRLKSLFRSIDALAMTITGGSTSDFVDVVVETRNYYTHWNEKSQQRASRGEALFYVTSRLLALLELLLLREAGFDPQSPAGMAILERRVHWLPTNSRRDN